MISTAVWLLLGLGGLGYELYSLKDSDDLHQPLTWHLRRLFHRPWFLALGVLFWVWLPLHLMEVVP